MANLHNINRGTSCETASSMTEEYQKLMRTSYEEEYLKLMRKQQLAPHPIQLMPADREGFFDGPRVNRCTCPKYSDSQMKLFKYRIKFQLLRHPDFAESHDIEGTRVCCLMALMRTKGWIN